MAAFKIPTLAVFSTAILVCGLQSASAQSGCFLTEDLERLLADRYQERSLGSGLTAAGGILEIYRTADGSTWTAVLHLPDGRSCMVSNGENWRGADQVSFLPEA